MKSVTLSEKLALFSSHWDPHVVADYNNNEIMVVKFQGEFPFHKHDETDDFFYVLEGEMIMDISIAYRQSWRFVYSPQRRCP